MSKKLPVQRLDTLRRDLEARRAAGIPKTGKSTPWREIAKDYPGVPPGTLCAVFKGREPHKPAILRRLGLPVTVPVTVCVHCGKPPLAKHHVFPVRASGKPRPKRRNWRGLALVLAGLIANRR